MISYTESQLFKKCDFLNFHVYGSPRSERVTRSSLSIMDVLESILWFHKNNILFFREGPGKIHQKH